jgi:hypothetical protein|tara:strand:- start:670 stop:783 length:114 start_codon:yes stop_codon:yes gene_type:complete
MLSNIIEVIILIGCGIGIGWWVFHEIQRGIDTYDEED